MFKSLVAAGAVGVLSALTLVAPQADGATTTYALQVKQRPAQIQGDGSVTVVFWLRCQAGFNAFEYSASVTQGDTFGSAGGGPEAFILPCDGTRHRTTVDVSPTSGAFERGRATISVNVQIFDGQSDIDANDSETVWLKP
jgi:hypothetical protein